MNAKISVIVPIYNTGPILKKTLKSIRNQSFKNYECLLINDGSTNNITLKILKDFCALDNRFKLHDKISEGIEKTRIYGVSKASSNLVVFCDHDDYYEKDALQILYMAFQTSNADIIVANCYTQRFFKINCGRKIIKPFVNNALFLDKTSFLKEFYINFFGINKFPVSTWGKLYKKELFFDELQIFNVNFIEDIIINLQIFDRANSVHFIPNSIYTHIYGGLSSKFNFEVVLTGYSSVYNFRKLYLLKNEIEIKPLLIEYKNVLHQGIDLLIDHKISFEVFKNYINKVRSCDLYYDIVAYLSADERGEYINLLENNEITMLYENAKSKYNIKRKLRHIIKNIVKRL